MSHARAAEGVKNVLLIHGGFVDGSGWQGVYEILKKDGYNVSIVQNPTTSLADDVAVTRRMLATQNGPAILVGPLVRGRRHYRGGERSESRGDSSTSRRSLPTRASRCPIDQEPGAGQAVPWTWSAPDGFLFLDRTKFRAAFAADVSAAAAAFMADSQVPWGLEALDGAHRTGVEDEAELVASADDKMIPPDAQRAMSKRAGSTVVEVKGSHSAVL